MTVAVVGSGVDNASGVLTGRLALGPREFGAGGAGRDCVGHGSAIAALIAARYTPGTGFAGIAPAARIYAVGATDDTGNTNADLLGKGIRAAADSGARVIDVAVAVPVSDSGLSAAVRYAAGKGALVVAPAALDMQVDNGPVYPAADPSVLAVADLTPAGAVRQSTSTGRVDLLAPGDAIMATGPGGSGVYVGSGPSFATAFVAGAAALVLAYRPALSAAQLLHRLETTAYHPGTSVPDGRMGYGAVDPISAVTAALPEEGPTTGAVRSTPPPGDLAMPPVVRHTAVGQAVAVAGGAVALIVVVVLTALTIPRGRRRNWRPGDSSVLSGR